MVNFVEIKMITMKVSISKKVNITSVNQWFNVAPPEGGVSQWRPGRSAMEMARFALSDGFPVFISEELKRCGIRESYLECEPEALTPFPSEMGINGPRHHDLLMLGKNVVVGIEAKVSESFDKRIGDKKKGATDNMKTRLKTSLEYIYGDNVPEHSDELFYQLFSATIGTLEEAKKRDKKKAVILFVTFVGDVSKEKDYDNNVRTNNEAFKSFCQTLGLDEKGGKLSSVPGAEGIECWIRKIDVNVGSYSF